MIRNTKSQNDSHAPRDCNDIATAAMPLPPWTRRKFLANSTGFAIAGAIGGLATQLPASARESATGDAAHDGTHQSSAHVTSNA
ncbi:MAG: twin-arginine translocation signal domain-containing protein, partial [Candidatus Acidiferrales bacterium]